MSYMLKTYNCQQLKHYIPDVYRTWLKEQLHESILKYNLNINLANVSFYSKKSIAILSVKSYALPNRKYVTSKPVE